MDMNLSSKEYLQSGNLKLENSTRRLFDEQGQENMVAIFRKELNRYQLLFNEAFGMHSQQQKQICFLCEGLLGSALYFEVIDLQNALQNFKEAACREVATRNLLDIVNQEIDLLLGIQH